MENENRLQKNEYKRLKRIRQRENREGKGKGEEKIKEIHNREKRRL